MPIVNSDINLMYLSGGAGNTDIQVSLGGVISSSLITSGSLHNLFDLVSSAESLAGDTEYKCIYVKNSHSTLTLQNAKIWIASNTANPDTIMDIGLGPSPISGTEQITSNESTTPSGVVFTRPSIKADGILIGDLIPGATKAIWIRRTVNTNASAINDDSFLLGFGGDTAA